MTKPRVCRGCLRRPATRALYVRQTAGEPLVWAVCLDCLPRQYRIAERSRRVDRVDALPAAEAEGEPAV